MTRAAPRHTPAPPSCALRVGALLGITLDARGRWPGTPRPRARQRTADGTARTLLRLLEPGEVALISGPSGAGKTTLVRAIGRALRAGRTPWQAPRPAPPACLVARLGLRTGPGVRRRAMDLDAWLGTLAHMGLAEAGALLARVGTLSTGQRVRAELAAALHAAAHAPRSARGAVVLIDECTSSLDRLTARGVCAGLRRVASAHGLRIIAAGAHHDLGALLRPHVHARVQPHTCTTVTRTRPARRTPEHAPCA